MLKEVVSDDGLIRDRPVLEGSMRETQQYLADVFDCLSGKKPTGLVSNNGSEAEGVERLSITGTNM